MEKTRRIAVFLDDGTSLFDQPVEAKTTTPQSLKPHSILADRLWPLIQVFVQFSREVHGGEVKRLVFRSPESYAPTHNQFEPASHPGRPPPVIVVYIARGDRFVVAVTERLVADSVSDPTLAVADDTRIPVDTVPEFCAGVLAFLQREQETFLATLSPNRSDGPADDLEPGTSETPSLTQLTSSVMSSRSSHSDGPRSTEAVLPGPTPAPPLVTIDTAKLSDFITRNTC